MHNNVDAIVYYSLCLRINIILWVKIKDYVNKKYVLKGPIKGT